MASSPGHVRVSFARTANTASAARPPGVLERLTDDVATTQLVGCETFGMDVRLCSGPTSERECCPLVSDGFCPLGPCDVVVSDIEGAWASPVHRAWQQLGVPVARPVHDPDADAG